MTTTTYSIISGNLPAGLSLSSTGTIYGVPDFVIVTTRSKFVIRTTTGSTVTDKTFTMDIEGSGLPAWNTPSGFLQVGIQGEEHALNKQWVDYQLSASDVDAPDGTIVKYFIAENDGTLPPGLHLSESGVISGFITDNLIFDGSQADTGGYDEESYDGYSYDHGEVAVDPIGVPKIYQFRVTATDSISTSKRSFKILVVSPEMIRTPELIQMTLPPGIIQTNTNYLPPLQFIKGTDLGIVRANNNQIIEVAAYDPYPTMGTVVYTITSGNDITTQLPEFLNIDSTQGVIYGVIPYQPAYTRNYSLTINATRTLSTASVTSTNIFSLAVKGEVESAIEWVSSSTLGTIVAGETSELAVIARQIKSDYTIKYNVISGIVPNGLTLERDGSLSGSVNYGTTGTFTFGVRAQDVHELNAIDRIFSVDVSTYNNKSYTKTYVRPFLPLSKREIYRNFMTDEFTFPSSSMYRFYDPNFGVQTDIKMVLEFGIEQLNLEDYVPALRENFYRKRIYFGDVKVAVAKNSSGTVVYEIVYIDAVDDQVNSAGTSVSKVVYTNNDIYYPNSIDNMRKQLSLLVLEDFSVIDINEFDRPLFMRTVQEGSFRPAGYMRVIPLCYVKPGEGSKIVSRIKLSNFDFKQFDFEVDRLIIENSLDNSTAKYLIFERQSLGDTIATDSYLFGPDEVELLQEDSEPIFRE